MLLTSIEKYAKEFNIPIMEEEGINFLCNYIKDNNVKTILEIGTAIGYSSIKMASVSSDITITTIERDKNRYLKAVDNIKEANLTNRIDVINSDALKIDINNKYDLIFIDAAKSQSIAFFNKYKDNLNTNGSIITDNLSFHGLVAKPENLSRNVRGIVRKINNYIEFLNDNDEYTTEFILVGDKISVSKKK